MLHAAATSFGAFFALRFLLGKAVSMTCGGNLANVVVQECVKAVSPPFLSSLSLCSIRKTSRCVIYHVELVEVAEKKFAKATRISWFYVMVRVSCSLAKTHVLIHI